MNKQPLEDETLKEHSFDGIQEYDKNLPVWWLWTLYLTIAFSFGYWFWSHLSGLKPSDEQRLQNHFAALQKKEGSSESRELTDHDFWEISRNPRVVSSGQKIYQSTCASCHGQNLEGGIGVSLADTTWKHGGSPTQIANVVLHGVLENGMPAWGSVLGERRVQEVVAFVISKHQPPEP
ncbi:MAG: c-type cytochrome [Candidatus Methylacidiphilales bacterium]